MLIYDLNKSEDLAAIAGYSLLMPMVTIGIVAPVSMPRLGGHSPSLAG